MARHGYCLRSVRRAIDILDQQARKHVWRMKGGSVKRILVVDDDPGLRDLLTEVLQEQYIVSTASNGAAALDAMRHCPPDAVVLDMMMPVMDGWTFLRACRRPPQRADVLVMVVSAEPTACQDGMQLGAQACIQKPFDVHHLTAAVERLFADNAQLTCDDAC